jgi:O-antigen ligase
MVITIPWDNNLNSKCIVAFCILSGLSESWYRKKPRLISSLFWVCCFLYFLTIALSLVWSPSSAGLKPLEKYAAFLLLAPILTASGILTKPFLRTSLLCFVGSVLIIIALCFFRSYLEYTQTHDFRLFYYQYLSEQMHLNAIYLSLYCAFSIFVLVHYFFIENRYRVSLSLVILSICLILEITIFLLSSKMVIFISGLLMMAVLLYVFYLRKKLLTGVLVLGCCLAAGVLIVSQMPYLRWRIEMTQLKKYTGTNDDQNGVAARELMWASSIELIKERPLLGYSPAKSDSMLVKKYQEKGFQLGVEKIYNAHNNFLQSWLDAGVAGFISLLLLLGYPMVRAFRYKSLLYSLFMILMATLCITESVLTVQKGIVFFVIFAAVFDTRLFADKDLKEPSKRESL